jgi:DNA-binding LacI/PurR family transcriptional regulator
LHFSGSARSQNNNCDRSQSVSIRDVAAHAGVSYQTVSRVINDKPNVSSAAREAVEEAIAALGFRPNRAARALAGGPIESVTVLASNTSHYGFAAAIQGIEEATRLTGFRMGFRAVGGLGPRGIGEEVAHAVEPSGALIVIAFDQPGVEALESVPPEVPTVAMIQAPTGDAVPLRPSVWINETSAATEATEYLLSLGHATVHHLPIPSWPEETARMRGWRAALVDAGVEVPEPAESGWTADWGYAAGRSLARDSDVTAVLCGNDDIALGAMRAMQEAGRSVPGDVSIIGFDDIPYAQFLSPPLTTVRQDFKALGKVCFAELLELADSSRRMPTLASPQARLIIRDSAGSPPGVSADSASAKTGSPVDRA